MTRPTETATFQQSAPAEGALTHAQSHNQLADHPWFDPDSPQYRPEFDKDSPHYIPGALARAMGERIYHHAEPELRQETAPLSNLLSTEDPPKCDQDGCKQPGPHSGSHIFILRVSAKAELEVRYISRSKPELANALAKNPKTWLKEVNAAIDVETQEFQAQRGRLKPSHWARNLRAVATGIADGVWDWRKALSRPTWAKLREAGEVSRDTVRRALNWLRAKGLLSVVATGQSAANSRGQGNLAAVYALWSTGANHNPEQSAKTNAPPTSSETRSKPTRARGQYQKNDALRATEVVQADLPPSENTWDDPNPGFGLAGSVADGGSPAKSLRSLAQAGFKAANAAAQEQRWGPLAGRRKAKHDRIRRAWELRELLPVLRATTLRAIAAEIRLFVDAGWTNEDIIHAIDRVPSGQRWPHSADWLIGRPNLWLRYRLKSWISDDARNPVLESVSQAKQRRQAEQWQEQLRRRRAEEARELARKETLANHADRYGNGVSFIEAARLRAKMSGPVRASDVAS